jgi:hypothetical protein
METSNAFISDLQLFQVVLVEAVSQARGVVVDFQKVRRALFSTFIAYLGVHFRDRLHFWSSAHVQIRRNPGSSTTKKDPTLAVGGPDSLVVVSTTSIPDPSSTSSA